MNVWYFNFWEQLGGNILIKIVVISFLAPDLNDIFLKFMYDIFLNANFAL